MVEPDNPRGVQPDPEWVETAYHEAGHVVMACMLGRFPRSVSLLALDGIAGRVNFDDEVPDYARGRLGFSAKKQLYLEQRAMVALAGTVSQDLQRPGRRHDKGNEHDIGRAREILEPLKSSEEHLESYVKTLAIHVRDRLRQSWPLVEAIAAALLDRCNLVENDIREILSKAHQQWEQKGLNR